MIKVKHLMDATEPDDGERAWVEPVGLTADLKEWCGVDHVLSHLGPPVALAEWFEEHPDGYEYFRARYHEALACGPYKDALQQLACVALRRNFTLLHAGSDTSQNVAAALHEYLSELEAYCPRED